MKILSFLSLMLLVSCGGSSGGGGGSKAQDPITEDCSGDFLSETRSLCMKLSSWTVEAKSFNFPKNFAISFEEESENGDRVMETYIDTCSNTKAKITKFENGTSQARFKNFLIKNVMRRIDVVNRGADCSNDTFLYSGYPTFTSVAGGTGMEHTIKIILD